MKQLNNYIIEKLRINDETKLVSDVKIAKDAITEYMDIRFYKDEYSISTIGNTISIKIKIDCGESDIENLKKDMDMELGKKYNLKFIFITNWDKKIIFATVQ